MSLLRGVHNVGLLAEEDIPAVNYIFDDLGSCSPVLDSEGGIIILGLRRTNTI